MATSLEAVPDGLTLDNNTKPVSTLTDLSTYLNDNDCTKADDKDGCYMRSRLVMIRMARRIDYLDNYRYLSNSTIIQLRTNIAGIVSTLNNAKVDPVKIK